jgi:integrase/recombinase XerD
MAAYPSFDLSTLDTPRLDLRLRGGQMTVDTWNLVTWRVSPDGPRLTAAEARDLADEFIDHLERAEDLKAETLTGYRRRLGQFTRWLIAESADPSLPETWETYLLELKQRDLSPFTRKGHYDRLRRFARWLFEAGKLPGNPLNLVKPVKLPKDLLPKAIAPEDIRAMLAAAEDSPRDKALLMFLRDSGGRAAEVLGMRWGDVDFDKRRSRVIGKGSKSRYLFFSPVVASALAAYRETVPHEIDDPVWVSTWVSGKRSGLKGALTHPGLRHVLKRLAARAGVEGNYNPHAWRHAFGRDMSLAGAPTTILQDTMGHSDIRVTTIYTKFDDVDLREAHDRYSPLGQDD